MGLSHTQSCKTFLQAMLDVLEHGDENRICIVGMGKKEKSSAHPPAPSAVRSRFRSSVWPSSQGQGCAQTCLGDHREHFSLLGKSCCLAAKIT